MEIVRIILDSILSAITPQINVTLVVGVLVGCIGVSVGLVFMWWGIRKLIHIMMVAFTSGNLSVGDSKNLNNGKNVSPWEAAGMSQDAWFDSWNYTPRN